MITNLIANARIVNPKKSTTFNETSPDLFSITYVDDNFAKGDWFQDRFEIGGAVVENLTMGLATSTTVPYGLVGVGYVSNEASTDYDRTYPNLPVAMHKAGSIKTIAYSLWLNDLDANTGSILFGGIDTGKFVGPMSRIKILEGSNDVFTHFTVAMTSLEATSPSGTDVLTSESFPIKAILDAGTTLSYVPQDLAEQVWDEVGAVYDASMSMAILPCSHARHQGYFSFGFAGPGGPKINITMDELVVDLTNGRYQSQFSSGKWDGELVCQFGVQNSSSSPYLLGDTFLRSAYVVYDLVNNEIGLAATDFNSTKTNIVPFASNGATIPSATVAPNQDEATQKPKVTEPEYNAAAGFQDEDEDSVGSTLEISRTGLTLISVVLASWVLGGVLLSTSLG